MLERPPDFNRIIRYPAWSGCGDAGAPSRQAKGGFCGGMPWAAGTWMVFVVSTLFGEVVHALLVLCVNRRFARNGEITVWVVNNRGYNPSNDCL